MPTTAPWLRSDLHVAVLGIARRAGREILEVYGTDFATGHKADSSPITQADLRAHRLIVSELARLTPSLPVLSEESVDQDAGARRGWPRFWLVDPLDGTREFVSRNGEFTVNIALIDDGRPAFGVVHVPVTGRSYWGAPGAGAWQDTDVEARRPLRVRNPAAVPPLVLGSRSHGDPRLAARLQALGPHELHAVGSSIKLCLVAEGKADLYPRLGPTSEWDIAAGHAVVEAAGGRVVALEDGEPLGYNRRESLLNPAFVAGGDPALIERFRAAR
jgi:3'(2'), 5'-bisphosphate nucleotidase